MIHIEDNDPPIIVAGKIIYGTKEAVPQLDFLGQGAYQKDMFDLDEIKEIADYLLCFYNTHKISD